MPCCAEVNDTGSTGLVSIASPVSTSRHAGFCIPIRRSASLRQDLRQEPYAVTLHVRICAGGGRQWPSLPRPLLGDYSPAPLRRDSSKAIRLSDVSILSSLTLSCCFICSS